MLLVTGDRTAEGISVEGTCGAVCSLTIQRDMLDTCTLLFQSYRLHKIVSLLVGAYAVAISRAGSKENFQGATAAFVARTG
jgi:hypothetical protein